EAYRDSKYGLELPLRHSSAHLPSAVEFGRDDLQPVPGLRRALRGWSSLAEAWAAAVSTRDSSIHTPRSAEGGPAAVSAPTAATAPRARNLRCAHGPPRTPASGRTHHARRPPLAHPPP